MVILVSEDSNRYAHLFLIEREYFGFNTLESVVADNVFRHNYSMMQIKKKMNDGKILG
jgi:hypothetical protein